MELQRILELTVRDKPNVSRVFKQGVGFDLFIRNFSGDWSLIRVSELSVSSARR
jgi:hypothetical protein